MSNARIVNRFLPILLLLPLILIAACTGLPTEPDFTAHLAQEFELKYGQTVDIDSAGISVRFVSINFDARCPTGGRIVCYWEGMATIVLEVTGSGGTEQFQISITGAPRPEVVRKYSVDTAGFRFELTRLDPYPDSRIPRADVEDYSATLRVARTGGLIPIDPVYVNDDPPRSIVLDKYTLVDGQIEGSMLNVKFQYGGGCRPHYFFAYMSPSTFQESNPVQANIYFRHYANQDRCEALITKEVSFDLTPVFELHRLQYGSTGPIIFNLYEYSEEGIVSVLTLSTD